MARGGVKAPPWEPDETQQVSNWSELESQQLVDPWRDDGVQIWNTRICPQPYIISVKHMVHEAKTLSDATCSRYPPSRSAPSVKRLSGCHLALTTVHLIIHPAAPTSALLFEFLYLTVHNMLQNQTQQNSRRVCVCVCTVETNTGCCWVNATLLVPGGWNCRYSSSILLCISSGD